MKINIEYIKEDKKRSKNTYFWRIVAALTEFSGNENNDEMSLTVDLQVEHSK